MNDEGKNELNRDAKKRVAKTKKAKDKVGEPTTGETETAAKSVADKPLNVSRAVGASGTFVAGGTGARLISVGFGNIVGTNRIVAIVNPDSAPVKRICAEAKERGLLIDVTQGRRKRAAIICDSDHVILSTLQPETIAGRILGND